MSDPQWILLVKEARQAMTVQAIADLCGVKRTALSQVLNGCGNYGTGVSSTKTLEGKVLAALGKVTCPFLTSQAGQEVRIDRVKCREYAGKDLAVGSAQAVQHWRACRVCKEREN